MYICDYCGNIIHKKMIKYQNFGLNLKFCSKECFENGTCVVANMLLDTRRDKYDIFRINNLNGCKNMYNYYDVRDFLKENNEYYKR